MEREHIGIDLHKGFFQACAVSADGNRLWEGRFPRTADGIARLVARGGGSTRAVAVEASGPTWAGVEALTPPGAPVGVVDPRKSRLKAGVAAKPDRLDARRLAEALGRESVVSIYLPPPAIRALREVCRGRNHVVRLRSRLAPMIRALLLRNDAGEPPGCRLSTPRALACLAQVPVPPEAACRLPRLPRLSPEGQRAAQSADREGQTRAAADPIAPAVDGMTGLGPVRARTLRAEVGDSARCHRGAELASYAGVVPRGDRRADRVSHGRMPREGAPWLRWAVVEAARHAITRTDAPGRGARRLAVRKAIANARVALARGLCAAIVARWPRETTSA